MGTALLVAAWSATAGAQDTAMDTQPSTLEALPEAERPVDSKKVWTT